MSTQGQPTDSNDASDLRVVWLFNCVGAGGSLLYWRGILPEYLRRFPHSWFFTARPPSLPIETTDKAVRCVGSLKIPLGRRRGSYERQLVIGSPRILKTIEPLEPDVIVVQEFLSFAAYLALFRRRKKNTAYLLLLESDPVRGMPGRAKWWIRKIRRWMAARMDHFLTNNEGGRGYLVDELGVSADQVTVRPYLVSEFPTSDTDGALPAWAERDGEDRLVFLYVGQLVERKGIAQLIEAVACLEPDVQKRLRFWLVGEGQQREALMRLADERLVAELFRFVGHVPYEDLAVVYQAADAFVMPTLDDYRALVGFEALGHGLPMLHSIYDGAVWEVVQEGRNGTRCDPRDPEQFARRIKWMIEHSDRFEEMASVSLAIHRSWYTVAHAVDALRSAIQTCYSSLKEPDGDAPWSPSGQ